MLFGSKYKTRLMVESTEVQPQQLTFAQSSSLSNNPKILDDYLIFTVQYICV